MMKVIRANTAGFCMGVSLALQKLDQAIACNDPGGRIYTLGPIIHNTLVLENYKRKGVVCADSTVRMTAGDRVLIRAHGIPRSEESRLYSLDVSVEDATCPKVKKAQLSIGRATSNGEYLLLFGDAEHPEVRGLVSYAHGEAAIFANLQELSELELDGSRAYVLASQTTQDQLAFVQIEKYLRSKLADISVLYTICDATGKRQAEAHEIAQKVDLMIVVGGKESGNTRRLADIAIRSGVRTMHVESVMELHAGQFRQITSVGLTAGASTPKSLVDEIESWLLGIDCKA